MEMKTIGICVIAVIGVAGLAHRAMAMDEALSPPSTYVLVQPQLQTSTPELHILFQNDKSGTYKLLPDTALSKIPMLLSRKADQKQVTLTYRWTQPKNNRNLTMLNVDPNVHIKYTAQLAPPYYSYLGTPPMETAPAMRHLLFTPQDQARTETLHPFLTPQIAAKVHFIPLNTDSSVPAQVPLEHPTK